MTKIVTIITPLHNAEGFISNCIESVISQTYPHWEMIIVDDCSTDGGIEIVKKYQERDSRIKLLINETNSGPAVSRNKAIEAANGKYIAFLDSDDMWCSTKLEEQLDFMRQNDYAFTFTAYDKINENGEIAGHIDAPHEVTYNDLLKTCSIGCLTVVYDTEKLGKVYMPIIKRRQDFALWLKILKIIPKAYGLNKPLAKYRLMSNSVSSNKFKASRYQWKVYRDIENLNIISSIYYFTYYTIKGLVKTYFK
ncbi:glycosyltransferase family 2 protein [Belliella marina]|uniref:Glycosyltransferase family 2 protein n=1 Tax=Belliella marina TaxID=1644146 RepID=A0ABW4VV90_9BACT